MSISLDNMTKRSMALSQRIKAVLNYETVKDFPVVHFGFWSETIEKWHREGYLTADEASLEKQGKPFELVIGRKLGFESEWGGYSFSCNWGLHPAFEPKVLETMPDGTMKMLDSNGAIVLQKKDVVSIPSEIDHLLKSRKEWEEHFLPKLQFCPERLTSRVVNNGYEFLNFQDGLAYLRDSQRDLPLGYFCGSLLGQIRNWFGVEGLSYICFDDEPLFDEIINTVAELTYKCAEAAFATGAKFDFAIFWEDICFKNGPLIVPSVYESKVGPHYKRLTSFFREKGIDLIGLDCDGLIDSLIPTWINNGVNVMFPIEVGTWDGNIAPWRERYGRELLGVGGMNKVVFAKDYAAIDAEIERLKPLVELGGYLPCPDHRIAPDAKWENVQYYCDRMRQVFSHI